ncbi:hypothetical protein Drorol1_Dr00000163, partial [Drosera rotundifolia]
MKMMMVRHRGRCVVVLMVRRSGDGDNDGYGAGCVVGFDIDAESLVMASVVEVVKLGFVWVLSRKPEPELASSETGLGVSSLWWFGLGVFLFVAAVCLVPVRLSSPWQPEPWCCPDALAHKALSKIAQNLLEKELVEWQVNLPAGFKHKNDNKANIKVIGAASGAAAFGIAAVVCIAMYQKKTGYPRRKSGNTSWLPIYGAFATQDGKVNHWWKQRGQCPAFIWVGSQLPPLLAAGDQEGRQELRRVHAKAHTRLLLPLQPGKAQLLHSLLEKISRNKMCPFGSKEKYKACCEAVAERASSKSMNIAAISEADIIEIAWGLEASK